MAETADNLFYRRWRRVLGVFGALGGVAVILVGIGLLLRLRPSDPAEELAFKRRLALLEHQAAQRQALTSYGWVDKQAGVVRLPIEVAMEKLVAEREPKR